jgi:uroporphyrinogen decarboxylase
MNARTRILAALNHQETELLPVDFAGHASSGIAAIAYGKLRDYLGLEKRPTRICDLGQQLAVVDDDVLERFHIDTVELGRAFDRQAADWVDWVLPDGQPCQVRASSVPERMGGEWVLRDQSGRVTNHMPDGALYFEQVYYPFADVQPDHQALATLLPDPVLPTPTPAQDQAAIEAAHQLRDSTDRAVIGLFGGNLLEGGNSYYRNDNFLMLLAAEPTLAHDFLERLTAIHLANLERYLRLYGSSMDVILFGDDLGMQTGPMISPRMYREFFKPRHARLWRRAKELADVKVLLHCCGGVRPLLPDLIDAGLDAINPVQISCTGMDAAGLKRDFGRDLSFWGGGCDTRWILAHGTPAEIQSHVCQQVEIWRPGGGYVFQQVHNILADVPPQNIVAMFDALNACR